MYILNSSSIKTCQSAVVSSQYHEQGLRLFLSSLCAVPMPVIASFKKIKALVHNNSLLADALRKSLKLVSPSGPVVCHLAPMNPLHYHIFVTGC